LEAQRVQEPEPDVIERTTPLIAQREEGAVDDVHVGDTEVHAAHPTMPVTIDEWAVAGIAIDGDAFALHMRDQQWTMPTEPLLEPNDAPIDHVEEFSPDFHAPATYQMVPLIEEEDPFLMRLSDVPIVNKNAIPLQEARLSDVPIAHPKQDEHTIDADQKLGFVHDAPFVDAFMDDVLESWLAWTDVTLDDGYEDIAPFRYV
ncbi:MAG: hypothetical protein KGO83_07485, partial [Paenibacillaceae bacterium]|nr:hypothetical protein [Paenibacillaceae bacterium]